MTFSASDFHLFLNLKISLGGQSFLTEKVKTVVEAYFVRLEESLRASLDKMY